MRNLNFMFLAFTVFWGCEDEELSNDNPSISLVGNWNVNLEIFESSS